MSEKKLATVTKKWVISLSLVAVFITSVFFFSDTLIPFTVKRLVVNQAKGVRLEHFSYANCKWRKDGFVLSDVDLTVHAGQFEGKVKVPSCYFHLSWKGSSKAYFAFERPKVDLKLHLADDESKGHKELSYEGLSKILLPSFAIAVKEGTGQCHVLGHDYHFDFDLPLGVSRQIVVRNLRQAGSDPIEACSSVHLTVTKNKEQKQLDLLLASESFDIGLLSKAGLRNKLPALYRGLKAKGRLKGQAGFSYSNKKGLCAEHADFEVFDFYLKHPTYLSLFQMKRGHLAFNALGSETKVKTPLALVPYLDFLNDYTQFNVQVQGGYLKYAIGPGEKCLELKELDVRTQYQDSYLHHHHVKGDLHYAGKARPILLMGSESRSQINFYHQSMGAKKNKERWQCFFSFGSHGEHPCLDYSLELPSVSRAELSALMTLKNSLFYEQDYLALSVEGLKTYIRGELSDAHHYLRVHYLEADHLLYQDGKMGLKASHAALRCNLDLKKDQFYQHGSWDFQISEGFFEKERHQFDHIQFQGGMNGTYVKPSQLNFAWMGKETQCQFEGLLSHINAEVQTNFLPLEIKRLISSGICLESKQPMASKDVRVQLSMGLNASFSQIRTEGVCKVGIADNEAQEVDFAFNFAGMPGKAASLIPSYTFLMGWFKGDKLSADVINMAFYLVDKEWECKGHVDVEGSLTPRLVQINVDPTHVCFATDMAVLYQDPNSNKKAPRLNFTFDYAKKMWTGALPLDHIVLDLPTFGLKFTPFSSQVELSGEIFTFRDIKARSYEGLECLANMGLDFSKEGRALISVDVHKGSGSLASLNEFLNHFDPFKELSLPGEGKVALGRKGKLHVEAVLGEKEELTACQLKAEVFDYNVPISAACHLSQCTALVGYDSSTERFSVYDGQGVFTGEEIEAGRKDWRFKLSRMDFDVAEGKGACSMLMSSPTYDLIKLKSDFEKTEQGIVVTCSPQQSHILGSALEKFTLSFDSQGLVKDFDISGQASALNLYGMLDLVAHTQLVPLPVQLLHSIRSPQFKGELAYSLNAHEHFSTMQMRVHGEDVQVGKVRFDKVNIGVSKRADKVDINHFEIGDFALTGGADLRNHRFITKNVVLSFKDNFCHVGDGSFIESGRLSLKDSFFTLTHGGRALPFLKQVEMLEHIGKIKGDGHLEVVCEQDLTSMRCFGKLGISLMDCFEKGVFVDSLKPFSFELDALGNVKVYDAELFLKEEGDPNVWIKANLSEGLFELGTSDKECKLSSLHLVVPPEAVTFLASRKCLPFLNVADSKLAISGSEFVWENQIEADVDLHLGKEMDVKASIKDGYYWIGGQAWFLEKMGLHYDGALLEASASVKKEEVDLAIKAKGGWQKEIFATLELKEGQRSDDQSLSVSLASNDAEGVFIQSIEGTLFGLTCSLYHNPRASLIEKMVLTGGIRVNGYELAPYLPEAAKSFMDKFEVGRGYELSGDLLIYKQFSQMSKSHFSGYFKGKHMEFCGSEVDTLMSEIEIYPQLIELKNCHISDAAGLFEIPDMRIEQTLNDRWKLLIDKLHIQDFRPSLIKKVGVYRGKIKPLVIRSFAMEGIEGYVDDLFSFKGSGQFSFINTFKRDAHILDIPLEILGRLGLDMGLLIPVKGSVQFLLEEGIVHFLDLQDAYSHGDRSEFFLSKKELSYIDLDGNINIHIKMKQHVLLKITQPFTLSILGDVNSPKYSLH